MRVKNRLVGMELERVLDRPARLLLGAALELCEREHVEHREVAGVSLEPRLRSLDRLVEALEPEERKGAQRPEVARLEFGAGDPRQRVECAVRPVAREVVAREDERACGGLHEAIIGRGSTSR